MIKRRDFITYLLLSLVTCGIYSLYFLYTVTMDMNTMSGDDGNYVDPAIVVLLTVVTCGFYSFYWYYAQGNRLKALADSNNIPCNETGTSYLVWDIVGYLFCVVGSYITAYLFINNFNKVADRYNESVH